MKPGKLETEAIAVALTKTFPDIAFIVEQGWNDEKDYYIRVIADPGQTPDLDPFLPTGWKTEGWFLPDFRAHLNTIVQDYE